MDSEKTNSLKENMCLHPRPGEVVDELFLSNPFFDPLDLLQVKYEMLRKVRVDHLTIKESAYLFGLSRPSYYKAQSSYAQGGLWALLPQKSGPKAPYKLTEEVLQHLLQAIEECPGLTSEDLASLVHKRFLYTVHPRSIERALQKHPKKAYPMR